ncbi:MAG: DUF3365 domain-containing protein [Candidatus Electrothrix sp. AR4]|nr:DUF3365 domain-containing protein [Candidatus Electrothrix sp. AR4]
MNTPQERLILNRGAGMILLTKVSIQVKYFIVFLVTIGMVAIALLSGMYTLKLRQLRNEAMSVADQVVSFRSWVGGTGGVWVNHLTDNFPDFLGERTTEAGTFYSKNPALATRELSDIVSKSSSRASFRVTSANYRNPKNAPDIFETKAIQSFEKGKEKVYVEALQESVYRYAQPIYIKKPCLKCHGDPKKAPQNVIDQYGSKLGFGYKVGEIRGIISVELPNVTLFEIIRTLINPYSVGLLLGAFLINFIFTQRVLIHRLEILSKVTTDISKGTLDLALPENKKFRDEVDQVSHAIDLLRTSLVVAMEHLRKKNKTP